MFPLQLKKLIYILFILIFSLHKSQAYTLDELDRITEEYRKSGKMKDIIDINKKALAQYQKQNNKEGIVLASINISNYLVINTEHKESLLYLEKIEKDIEEIENPELKSRFYGGYGRNYCYLGMHELSNEYFNKAIKYGGQILDKNKRERRLYLCYSWKNLNFKELKIPDSIKQMERKCLALSPTPFLYASIAERFLDEKKHLDSAEYYLQKGYALNKKFSMYEKGLFFYNYGRLYTEKKDDKKALEYYLQAKPIFEKTKSISERRITYDKIYRTYKALNDLENADEYYKKYAFLTDSISRRERKAINIPIKNIAEEKDEQKKDEKFKLYIVILFSILASILTFYFIRKNNLKNHRQKDKIIDEKQQETDQLKKKVNPAIFNEVKELAKNADPFFLIRFKEVYPDFYNNLISKYPTLTSNELKFCALLRLNLSNKEISQYENLSIRTIETKRYRLRKKMNFSSDTDFNKWIMEL